ncbi:MAG: beta-lactamase family protein [Anaerolineales bacterium]|nr:beta-lactamase family protein [Anaerolineales bacterium]
MLNTAALHKYFQDLEARDEFSGVALVTRGEEQLFSGAYGYASRAWGIRNTLETRFDTASVTKLFTAVATLQLVDRGDLALGTRVIDFLGLKDTAISGAVTVEHLLTHTSGIGDDAEEEDGEIYENLWKTRPNYMVTETADFLPQFIHKPPNFPPGQGCRYCNCAFILLGLCIEKISGLSYRDYVRRNVFAPAGMAESDFLRLDRVHERTAEGSDPLRDEAGTLIGWKRNIYSYPPVGSPDSGAYVTASDLDRFLRAARRGSLLSPELTAAFFAPRVHYRDRENWEQKYGFVLWFYVKPDGTLVCCQKEGINAGVSAVIRYFPAEDINVVVLSNMEAGAWDPVWKVHAMIAGG